MSYILSLILISLIYPCSGWTYHNYNNRFLAARHRNVISVPVPSIIYPRMNEVSSSENLVSKKE